MFILTLSVYGLLRITYPFYIAPCCFHNFHAFYPTFNVKLIFLNSYFSTLQDDFVVLHVPGEYDTVFETVFKTELLTVLTKKYEAEVGKALTIDFRDK